MTKTYTRKRPKTYQVPKPDHPWRQYANKRKPGRKPERTDVVHIKEFLEQIVENWDSYEIYVRGEVSAGGFRKVRTLPQKKVAVWLTSIVKKTYVDGL